MVKIGNLTILNLLPLSVWHETSEVFLFCKAPLWVKEFSQVDLFLGCFYNSLVST